MRDISILLVEFIQSLFAVMCVLVELNPYNKLAYKQGIK